jgi:hypothetical protein
MKHTPRDYLNLAFACLSEANRLEIVRAMLKALDPKLPLLLLTQVKLKIGIRKVDEAWGDLLTQPGWDAKKLLAAMKESNAEAFEARKVAADFWRTGFDAAVARVNELREGKRHTEKEQFEDLVVKLREKLYRARDAS